MAHWELFVGAIAIAAAFWRQLMGFVSWVKGWVVVTRKTDYTTGLLMLSFMEATMRRAASHNATYGSAHAYVRPLERVYRVVYQALGGGTQVFWKNRRPIWYVPGSVPRTEANNNMTEFHMEFAYVRGTFTWEPMLLAATAWEDDLRQGLGQQSSRFRVQYHYGLNTALLSRNNEARSISSPPETMDSNGPTRGVRLLQWSHDDIQGNSIVSTMANLSLRPELTALVDQLKFWHTSQSWYTQHGVPWRRGCLLWGAPGTGKTSYARAVAELLDIPVHVFDLSSMSNQDLKAAWQNMLTQAPCMALLEDLDAVFEGRTNRAQTGALGSGTLTFDCLLNCIDGIERVDGLLLMVTTNNKDALDPALINRPGRIDTSIEFKPLDHEGRVKLATRILDSVESAVTLAQQGAEDSAAQFQERCFQVALARRFETRPAVGGRDG